MLLISMKNMKRLTAVMYRIVEDPRPITSAAIKVEAAKVIAACAGVMLPDTNEAMLSTRQAVELRQARQAIAEKMRRKKERKRLENRRAYLKRKLRQQDQQPAVSAPAAQVEETNVQIG